MKSSEAELNTVKFITFVIFTGNSLSYSTGNFAKAFKKL